jgi:hypothetical protein
MTSRPDPRALLAQRRAHIRALRTRVAAVGVAAFLALWGVLYVQLATGHDPGLNDASPVAVVQSTDPAALTDTNTDTDTSDTAGAAGDDDAVTTRQS